MVMRSEPVAVIVEASGLEARAPALLHRETPGHAEMHHQRLAALKLGDEIFGAPAERRDACAFEPLGEARRKGEAQIGAAQLDAGEARAFEHRREATPNGFDFGKFRHDAC